LLKLISALASRLLKLLIGNFQLVADPFFITLVFGPLPFFLRLLLSILLINLLLERLLHSSALLLLLHDHDLLLITTLENGALLLKLNIKTILNNSPARHYRWKILLCLNRRVLCLLHSRWLVVVSLERLLAIDSHILRISWTLVHVRWLLLLRKALLLLAVEVFESLLGLLSRLILLQLMLLPVRGHWKRLIFIESELG
jgi:hypothetical protein